MDFPRSHPETIGDNLEQLPKSANGHELNVEMSAELIYVQPRGELFVKGDEGAEEQGEITNAPCSN
ncbi:hypothetical protein [Nostoc sp. ChiQUE01b]|uniref:hypothetical protein n=1 Tax=Nostoc sp. ChiQUE01b TaxID=3075376 RepID=UPI002AD3BF27|nr:hypothetical protein [Nostoc sp. ChiQUE01b]MDZ8262776.1 hypothetical protein [Nostoc sp. ChiQUE01b]